MTSIELYIVGSRRDALRAVRAARWYSTCPLLDSSGETEMSLGPFGLYFILVIVLVAAMLGISLVSGRS